MLRGAYSQINNFSKLILLLTLVISFLLFSVLIGILFLVPFYGTEIISALRTPNFSDPTIVSALKVLQIINSIGAFMFPAIIYMYLCSPKTEKYSRYFKSVSPIAVFLTFILIIMSQPVISWTSELNSYLTLPESLSFIENWIKNAETQGAQVTDAFLSTTSAGGFLLNIFMIAILPPFAEEILFRGALATLFKDWTKNVHLAVFISAFIFSAIHMQFYGFLPRFLLGTALGYLFFWSGSLWLPIAAHFTNNFLTVMVEFMYRKGTIQTNAEKFGMDHTAFITIISIIGVTGLLYYIYKLTMLQRSESL